MLFLICHLTEETKVVSVHLSLIIIAIIYLFIYLFICDYFEIRNSIAFFLFFCFFVSVIFFREIKRMSKSQYFNTS